MLLGTHHIKTNHHYNIYFHIVPSYITQET